jgi:hypothetical protein
MRLLVWLLVAGCSSPPAQPDQSPDDLAVVVDAAVPPDLQWVGPPVGTACASPTVTLGGVILNHSSDTLRSPHVAWDGSTISVAWAEVTSGGTFTIWLQHGTTAATLSGGPILTGTGTGGAPRVAVASDGTHAIVAWEHGSQVATASIANGVATAGASFNGAAPSLAFGAGGFVLAYRDATGITLQRIDATAQASAAAQPVAATTTAVPRLAATSSGYALAYQTAAASAWTLARFASDLTAGATASVAGSDNATELAVAGSGRFAGVVFAESATVVSAAVYDEAGTAGNRVPVNGTSTSVGHVGAAGSSASFGTAWADGASFAGYRAVDQTGAAQGSPGQPVSSNATNAELDLVAVGDGFVMAVVLDPTADQIQLAHLVCP